MLYPYRHAALNHVGAFLAKYLTSADSASPPECLTGFATASSDVIP